MAIFGRDFYGLAKYGADVYAEFDVDPFDANPDGYGAIRVSWHSPSGSWNRIRLLRSKYGYAVDEQDGTILVDSFDPVDHFIDTDLTGGCWYYYAIFIQGTDGSWDRAGATSSLAVTKAWGEVGHADLLWGRIPPYFRYFRKDGNAAVTDEYFFAPNTDAALLNPDLYDLENQQLKAFLDVLGWGLDWIHNYQTLLLSANDPKTAHLSDVDRLASELGIKFEYGVPAHVMRSKVSNAALLARRRGTLDGLKAVAELSTGWPVDISVGYNLMLNRDQSEFANPVFAEWNPGINYAAGQKVQYQGRVFTAKTGAYGMAMIPPSTGTNSNLWWVVTTDTDVTTLHRPDTNGVVTWKGFIDGVTPKTLALAVGVSDPVSGQGQESNALALRNTGTKAHTYDVVGASNLVGDTYLLPHAEMAMRQGIPIPRALVWDPSVEYEPGMLVQWHGATWRAIERSIGDAPDAIVVGRSLLALDTDGAPYFDTGHTGTDIYVKTDTDGARYFSSSGPGDSQLATDADGTPYYAAAIGTPLTGYWEKVGVDDRPTLAYSFYAHGPLTGSTGAVAVTPGLAFFDQRGGLLVDQVAATPMTNFVFDTFNHLWGNPDFGSSWTTTGQWTTQSMGEDDGYVAYPLGGTGTALATTPTGLTSYRVAATFAKAPATGRTDSLAIRYVDANNYMRVTRTKVQKRVSGTLSTVATLSVSITDGDRVTVIMDDTAKTFVVIVNKLQVATGTLSGGTAPFRHGLMVE